MHAGKKHGPRWSGGYVPSNVKTWADAAPCGGQRRRNQCQRTVPPHPFQSRAPRNLRPRRLRAAPRGDPPPTIPGDGGAVLPPLPSLQARKSDGHTTLSGNAVAAAIQSARAFLGVRDACGTFDAYIWQFIGGMPRVNAWPLLVTIPAQTPEPAAMSKDLRQRGFTIAGPTICYAFMQATGMVNDHTTDCFRHAELGG